MEKFIDRKYPTDLVEQQFQKARKRERNSLIFQERKKKEGDEKKVRLIFTHNRGNPPLHKWIRESKKLLVTARGRNFGKNSQIAYKQPRNLKKIVSGFSGTEMEGGKKYPSWGLF